MPSGGYRLPSTPAMASGPGALSKRTDGGPASKQAARYLAGGDYGDGGLMSVQNAAPMAKTLGGAGFNPMPGGQTQQMPQQGPPVIPLTAPSQRPDEPVTSGAAAGAGPGVEALGLPPQPQQGGTSAKQIVQGLAAHPDASPALKQLADLLGK